MNLNQAHEILRAAYPEAEIRNEMRTAKNTGNMIENVYVDGKLAAKGRLFSENFHFCNEFRALEA